MFFRAEWDQLLLAARGGDSLALERLLEAAGDDLQAAAAGVVGHKVQQHLPVEEVYAESLLAVAKDFASLRATNYIGFRYWFASIARNNVRRALRRERSRAPLQPVEEGELETQRSTPQSLARESLLFVRRALNHMPRSQQVAYVLREGLGLSWRTIGFALGHRGPAAARLVHYRAAQRVQALGGARLGLRVPPVILA